MLKLLLYGGVAFANGISLTQNIKQNNAQQEYEQAKALHKQEVNEFKKWAKLSPFYLKHHPEERSKGDISDLQAMTKNKEGADELTAIEDVFEKNLGSFNKLVSQSDANQQLQHIKDTSKSQNQKLNKPKAVGVAQTSNVKIIPGKAKALAQNRKNKKLLHLTNIQKSGEKAKTENEKKDDGELVFDLSSKATKDLDLATKDDEDDEDEDDTSLLVSKMKTKSRDIQILPSKRSFNSDRLKKKASGDYSKKAETAAPKRRMMNQIAMLETQVLAMSKRIKLLEHEKKEDRFALQLLQTHNKQKHIIQLSEGPEKKGSMEEIQEIPDIDSEYTQNMKDDDTQEDQNQDEAQHVQVDTEDDSVENKNEPELPKDVEALAQGIDETSMTEESMNIQLNSTGSKIEAQPNNTALSELQKILKSAQKDDKPKDSNLIQLKSEIEQKSFEKVIEQDPSEKQFFEKIEKEQNGNPKSAEDQNQHIKPEQVQQLQISVQSNIQAQSQSESTAESQSQSETEASVSASQLSFLQDLESAKLENQSAKEQQGFLKMLEEKKRPEQQENCKVEEEQEEPKLKSKSKREMKKQKNVILAQTKNQVISMEDEMDNFEQDLEKSMM